MEIALSEAALGADPAVENVFNLAENFAFDVMSRRGPSFATSLSVNARTPRVSAEQLQRSQHYFNPAPILRFTVGKFSQLPVADGPEVVFLGRSNVGKSSLLNALFPNSPRNFARVSSQPGHTRTLNGYTVPKRRFTIIDLPGYGYRGREEWEDEIFELLQARRSLRKAYLLLDSLHGPKDKDIQMLSDLAKTGIAHQLVLTKLDRASPTIWKEIGTALKDNPDPGTEFKSASRSPLHDQSSEVVARLTMGVWGSLRRQLGFGCDETILGVSSEERLGLNALRYSILQACGVSRGKNFEEDEYVKALRGVPVVDESGNVPDRDDMRDYEEEDEEERKLTVKERLARKFDDKNPWRGEVYSGAKMLRQRIYRW